MPLARLRSGDKPRFLAKGGTREGCFTLSRALLATLDALISPGRARHVIADCDAR